MDIADDNRESGGARAAADLAQRMVAARASTADAMERLLDSATNATKSTSGALPPPLQTGTGFLLFLCAGRQCAVPLSALREVLPAMPRSMYLPFSPAWMLGIFPLRNEMIGLVDPVPLLTRASASEASADHAAPEDPAAPSAPSPPSPPPHSPGGVGSDVGQGTALLVGSEDRCLAWAVDLVGEIAIVQDAELRALTDASQLGLPFARRYVTHIYSLPDGSGDAFVLDAEALLTDLLDQLTEEHEGQHG